MVSKARSKGKGDHALRDNSTCVPGTNSHPPGRHQAASQRPRVSLLVSPQATRTAKLRHCSPPSDAPNKADARPPGWLGHSCSLKQSQLKLLSGPTHSCCGKWAHWAKWEQLQTHSLLPVVMADRQSLLYGHLIGHRRDCEIGTI